MITFRQKEFIAPLLALTAAGTGVSMLQGQKQQKELEKQGEENARAAEQQAEIMKEQNRKLEKIAEKAGKNPQAAVDAAKVIKEHTYSSLGALKTLSTAAKGAFGKGAMSNIKMGAAVGGTTYLAGKYIQKDMKKEGMQVGEDGNLEMKSYSSIGSLVKSGTKVAKDLGKIASKNKGTLAMGAALGGVPLALGYTADKAQVKDQIQATQQRAYSAIAGIGKSLAGIGRSMKGGMATFRSHPMQSLSGGASNLASFGIAGTKNTQKFARSLALSNNNALSKAGNWMTKHKTATNMLAIAPGAVAAKVTWDGSTKATEKVTGALDPGAYEYKNSKDQQVQQ